ncbi:MAG: hypothetical protein AUJ51_00260 [Elusimicrobia bacterium CG1_02_56_21]|nr:MAG: hypothetical protein AUJ51_00260 [Elusimicrobia bacterium CG1_02_56_21]
MTDKRLPATTECIEPELISPGSVPPRREEPRRGNPPQKPGLLTRLKILAAGGLAVLGLGLFTVGALLTSTVIGAILGIPLMIAGALAFFLLFRILGSGSANTFTFRRF